MKLAPIIGLLALGCAAQVLAGEPDGPPAHWRGANDAVGHFPRGHADILRAEEEQARREATVKAAPPATAPVLTVAAALRGALLARPDLIAAPDMSAREIQKLRVEVAELRHTVQRAWTDAVLAEEQLRRQRTVQEGSEVGLELARRMTQVGNWSRARSMENELAAWRMRGETLQYEQTAASAREALVRLIGNGSWRLPETLPPPPALASLPESSTAVEELEAHALRQHPSWPLLDQEARWRERAVSPDQIAAWRQYAEAMVDDALRAADQVGIGGVPLPRRDPSRQLLPHALERAVLDRAEADALARTVRSQVREARRQLIATHALAEQAAREVQRLATALQEETLLRYNGMFVGTWDLLASAQARIRSEMAVSRARRDFWFALANLRALLAGATYVVPGQGDSNGGGEATAARPH